MARVNKYHSNAVLWDIREKKVIDYSEVNKYRRKGKITLPKHIFRFDSTLEFNVYLELCRMYTPERITRQHKVPIASPGYCYPNGRTWRVDFAIHARFEKEIITHLVEAKGAWLAEFTYTLALLEQQSLFAFTKLRIVAGSSLPEKNRVVKALVNSKFKDHLITYRELKTLQQLP